MLRSLSTRDALQLLAANRRGEQAKHPQTGKALPYNPPDIVAQAHVLQDRSLKDMERYSILEQLVVACLDAGRQDDAEQYLKAITAKFPVDKSTRVQMLHGRLHQSRGEWKVAEAYFDMILEADECNLHARMFKIGLLAAQGKRIDAIKAMTAHLDIFMQDQDSWLQLSKWYTQERMFQQAAFCLEELMILRPNDPFLFIRYADLQVMSGDLPLAIKYYCQALDTCKDHLRGLYGLITSCKSLLHAMENKTKINSKIEPQSQDMIEELLDLAKERVEIVYQGDNAFVRDRGLEKVIQHWIKLC
jgi:tetratricopeptide (TPR) repeat protein